MTRAEHADAVPEIRCAIYTRKSTDEGLDQDFSSLDAQREAAEAYIASQASEGWSCLPDRYDDGGYSGGDVERPAVQRLLADIQDGRVDCVVVYKVDRLSRSLMDFARMLETFERYHVSFVSVTQQFNTTHSMGRLTLNILLSFAQFEREIISERTRDKIAASRRKGKWAGGRPILGFDVDPKGPRLITDEAEAAQVRAIFELYLEKRSLLQVAAELNQRGWTTKRWVTRKGGEVGGCRFNKQRLHTLLTNVAYIGKIRHRDEVYEGEHDAIIDLDIWRQVQALLRMNGRTGGGSERNTHGALLKRLLFCGPCGCAMSHSFTTKNGNRRYRYYVCVNAQKQGWHTCPSKSVPAEEIEAFVVDRIRRVGRDPRLRRAVVEETERQSLELTRGLESERRAIQRELKRLHAEIRGVCAVGPTAEASGAHLAQLHERIRDAEQRAAVVRRGLEDAGPTVTREEIEASLSEFGPVWDNLSPREQADLLRLLIRRIEYDGETGTISMAFLPTGLQAFARSDE